MAETLNISVTDLQRLRNGETPCCVLDVREAWELAEVGLSGAHHIPLGALVERHHELPQQQVIAVICHHGGRSLQAVQYLRAQGYGKAVNVVGGIDQWAAEIDPTLPRY